MTAQEVFDLAEKYAERGETETARDLYSRAGTVALLEIAESLTYLEPIAASLDRISISLRNMEGSR